MFQSYFNQYVNGFKIQQMQINMKHKSLPHSTQCKFNHKPNNKAFHPPQQIEQYITLGKSHVNGMNEQIFVFNIAFLETFFFAIFGNNKNIYQLSYNKPNFS